MKKGNLAEGASKFCKRKITSQKITKACNERGWRVTQVNGFRGYKLKLVDDEDEAAGDEIDKCECQ